MLMEIFTKETGRTIKQMAVELILIRMVLSTKEVGKRVLKSD